MSISDLDSMGAAPVRPKSAEDKNPGATENFPNKYFWDSNGLIIVEIWEYSYLNIKHTKKCPNPVVSSTNSASSACTKINLARAWAIRTLTKLEEQEEIIHSHKYENSVLRQNCIYGLFFLWRSCFLFMKSDHAHCHYVNPLYPLIAFFVYFGGAHNVRFTSTADSSTQLGNGGKSGPQHSMHSMAIFVHN